MTAISNVVAARLALARIGSRSNIESFTEESPVARQARLWFDVALEKTLEAYDWSFARKTAALSSHADAPTNGWGFRYSLPSDCVKFRRVLNPLGLKAETPPHRKEISSDQITVLTNVEQAVGQYTMLVTNLELCSSDFIDAFVVRLGGYMAPNLLGDKGLKVSGDMEALFRQLIKDAGANDANSERDIEDQDASWIKMYS